MTDEELISKMVNVEPTKKIIDDNAFLNLLGDLSIYENDKKTDNTNNPLESSESETKSSSDKSSEKISHTLEDEFLDILSSVQRLNSDGSTSSSVISSDGVSGVINTKNDKISENICDNPIDKILSQTQDIIPEFDKKDSVEDNESNMDKNSNNTNKINFEKSENLSSDDKVQNSQNEYSNKDINKDFGNKEDSIEKIDDSIDKKNEEEKMVQSPEYTESSEGSPSDEGRARKKLKRNLNTLQRSKKRPAIKGVDSEDLRIEEINLDDDENKSGSKESNLDLPPAIVLPKITISYFDVSGQSKNDEHSTQIINKIISRTNEEVKLIKIMDEKYSSYYTGTNRIVYQKSNSPTYYLCPPRSYWSCLYNLPYGYEVSINNQGRIYFINHLESVTTNMLPHELESKNSDNRSSEDDGQIKEIEVFLPKKVKGCGMDLKNVQKGVLVDKIHIKSVFLGKLREGDIIKSINSIPVARERDIPYFLAPKKTIVVSIIRVEKKISDFAKNKGVKSSFKTKDREEYLKKFPARVHFSEAPIVINYQLKSVDTWKGSKFTDNFDDIIKVSFPDGTFRTQRFTNEQIISAFIKPFIKSLKINEYHCFTLALLPRGSTDIEYFGRHDLVSTVNTRKQAQDQTECFLVMYTYPRNINSFNDPKYAQIVDFLFQQFRLFLFTARFRNIFIIQKNDLHQLISLSATIDFMSNKSKMQSEVLEENQPVDQKKSAGNEPVIKLDADKPNSPAIRLSTINLEEHPIYPPLSTIKDLRKDLDTYFISCLMINVFDIIVPSELKFYFLANKGTVIGSKNEYMKVSDRIPSILQKSQICFIKACVECKISPVARYRVVVQTYLNGKTCLNTPSPGFPETLAVSSRALEFHREYATEFILYLKNIVAVTGSRIDEGHYSITIFSADEKFMTVSIQNTYYRSLLWMLAAGVNEIWREEPKITVPIFDLTNQAFRVVTPELPSYNNVHVLFPSYWNYHGNLGSFYHRLCGICSQSIPDVLQAISPYFVFYENPKDRNGLKLPFQSKSSPLKVFHLEFEEPPNIGDFLSGSEESIKGSQSSLSGESDLSEVKSEEVKSEDVDIYLSELSKKVDNVTRNGDVKINMKNM